MNKEKTPDKEKTTDKHSDWKKTLGLILNGKFFPRRFFADNWGILLTITALFLASIAHRNMYMLQLNKIKKTETLLIDRTTDRILLEYERDKNMRLHEISEVVEQYGLPLIYSPEPKKEIMVKYDNPTPTHEK